MRNFIFTNLKIKRKALVNNKILGKNHISKSRRGTRPLLSPFRRPCYLLTVLVCIRNDIRKCIQSHTEYSTQQEKAISIRLHFCITTCVEVWGCPTRNSQRVQHAGQERTTVSQNVVHNLQRKTWNREMRSAHLIRRHAANLPWRK